MTSYRLNIAMLCASTALIAPALHAEALPTGADVVAGSVSVATPSANVMNITQGSDRAVVNWQSFSVGEGNRVDIAQPNAKSALLNRVTGDATSMIAGHVNANGRVYLVNPNGIMITKTGSVNAAAFTASTLDISDADFMAGSDALTVVAPSGAGNVGYLRGGLADLLGGDVADDQLIRAQIADAGDGTAALDLSGDGFMQLAVPEAGIDVAGTINAHEVVLTAGTAQQAAHGFVNLSGVVNATNVSGTGGKIVLTGADVTLTGASLDASGATGGGTVLVGGEAQGKSDLARATTLQMDAASIIRADATDVGDGRNVVLWSDEKTDFSGTISARGGANGGDGGLIETSGGTIAVSGTVDTRAANGATGEWLIDPTDFTIAASGGDMTGATISANLASANVTILSSQGAVEGNGDIFVNDAINWSSDNMLTLSAYRNIELNDAITSSGNTASLVLRADNTGTGSGTLLVGAGGSAALSGGSSSADIYYNPTSYTSPTGYGSHVTGGTLNAYMLVNDVDDLQGISTNLSGNYALSKDIDASATASWNSGAGFAPLGYNYATNFTGSFDGQGHVISDLTINRPGSGYVGLFGYNNGTIANVGVERGSITGDYYVGGLVGLNTDDGGGISNSYATASVSGRSAIGGLVGASIGNITGSHATGAVSGEDNVGGLVGEGYGGLIDKSYATGAVSASSSQAGGLVGRMAGTSIDRSYASGAVSASGNYVGGLVGMMFGGSINRSYATGSVNGQYEVGGLVGKTNSLAVISNVYASGRVSGLASTGGLIGWDESTISNAYWDSYSTGKSYSGTSATAVTSDPSQSGADNYAYKQSAYANFDFDNDWFMVDRQTRPFLRSEYSTSITNAHQVQLMAMDLTADYTLAKDIDLGETGAVVSGTASTYSGMWSGGGFSPIGDSVTNFTGNFDGAGHVLSGLTIYRPVYYSNQGLFGHVNGGTISNVGLSGGSVAGASWTGGLIGRLVGGTVSNSYYDGSTSGQSNVGGLVGYLDGGTVTDSYTTGTVTGTALYSGGLVGYNNAGTVTKSHSAGTVNGKYYTGGLIGSNFNGSVNQNYATGAVSGSNYVGGLVANNNGGTVSQSYATGSVSGSKHVGGLVSQNGFAGTIGQSYATGSVTGTENVGGLVGYNVGGGIDETYATGAVSGTISVGGLVGNVGSGSSLSDSYWDSYTSGLSVGIGLDTGGTITNLSAVTSDPSQSDAANYAYKASAWTGFDLDTVGGGANAWRIYDGHGYPLLKAFLSELAISATGTGTVTYDGNEQSLTPDIAIAGDYESALLLGSATAIKATNAGSYSGNGASGLYSTQQGYDIVTSGSATLTIDPAALTITYEANGASRSYGDANGAFTGSVSAQGLIGADTISGVTSGTAAFASTADAASNVGTYAIDGSGLLANDGNYSFTFAQAAGNANALTVTARPISVTADGKSRIYGDANPALTYVLGGMGLVNGDTLSGALSTSATVGSDVGTYGIGQGTLAAGSNYALSYTGANLTITARPITVTTDAKSRIYGDTNPALTYVVGGKGLVNGDTLSGALSTGANLGSDFGTYGIAQGTLAAGSNYALSYTGADLTVTARPITVTADAKSRIYGDTNPALTYVVGGKGLVNGDTLSGGLTTSADATSDVGTYGISQGTLAASSNYALSYTGVDLSVTARPISIVADNQRRFANQPNPALTYVIGMALVNGDTLSGELATDAELTSSPGEYRIGQGTLTAGTNYAIGFTDGVMTIDPAAIQTSLLASGLVRNLYEPDAVTGPANVTIVGDQFVDLSDDDELLLTELAD